MKLTRFQTRSTTLSVSWTIAATAFAASLTCAQAQEFPLSEDRVATPDTPYSPYVDEHLPQNVYFGDTHLHTSWSADAGMAGATLGPDAAYQVARGEEVDTRAASVSN